MIEKQKKDVCTHMGVHVLSGTQLLPTKCGNKKDRRHPMVRCGLIEVYFMSIKPGRTTDRNGSIAAERPLNLGEDVHALVHFSDASPKTI
ncbi:MAG TPA: hypothetical protein VK879_05200 [Candidatus Sulfomarinibacteraceae bacterium]|nr:hypothetical protein [Candidatus Sulfomarinibacteraceae bacterium]